MTKARITQRCFKIPHMKLDSFLRSLQDVGFGEDTVEAQSIFLRPGERYGLSDLFTVSEDCYDVVVKATTYDKSGEFVMKYLEGITKRVWDEVNR